MLRRVSTVVVVVVGVCAISATSQAPPPGFPVSSPQKTIELRLDAQRPEARFFVDIEDTLVERQQEIALRADVNVADDDAAADDNDGVAVVDVGLVAEGEDLPADTEVAGDAAVAAVKEGAFGIERFPAGARAVLAVRLREGVEVATVSFVLTASSSVTSAPAAGEGLALALSPDTTFGDDE